MRICHFPLIIFLVSLFSSCTKSKPQNAECILPMIVPFQPYSHPVWHANGNLLGFNYTPLASITANGNAPCTWYFYSAKTDSAGFYLMNKDGSGLKRVTSFHLFAPAWSPDGNWIAFSLGSQLYKMRFTGNGFDTANMVQLTNGGGNFHPSWTANSDSIYYDSNINTNGQGYYIWKMASDGSGKIGFPNTGREPFVGTDDKIYYTGLNAEIYKMERNGNNKMQITTDGNINGMSTTKNRPKFYNGSIYYQQNGLIRFFVSNRTNIANPSVTYDISLNGEIVYSKMDYSITTYNKQLGTLWIMNADGSNNRQLTFNHL